MHVHDSDPYSVDTDPIPNSASTPNAASDPVDWDSCVGAPTSADPIHSNTVPDATDAAANPFHPDDRDPCAGNPADSVSVYPDSVSDAPDAPDALATMPAGLT